MWHNKGFKNERQKVKVPEDEQFIHENFMPAIINKEDFYMVQELFDKRVRRRLEQRIRKFISMLVFSNALIVAKVL